MRTVILDPEGKFFTLREKFGYVFISQGGETPADVRSAALLAQKLMELKLSRFLRYLRSLPFASHRTPAVGARCFLDALLEVPRSQWSPLIVIIDEAHQILPARDAESEKPAGAGNRCRMPSNPIVGLRDDQAQARLLSRLGDATARAAGRGSSAETLQPAGAGVAIEDLDVNRAADLMSVSPRGQTEFPHSAAHAESWPVLCLRARHLQSAQTRHGGRYPDAPSGESAKPRATPSRRPCRKRWQSYLPKLADLPKEAEDKARTEAEYKREIRELRMKVKAAERAQASAVAGDRRQDRIIKADPQQRYGRYSNSAPPSDGCRRDYRKDQCHRVLKVPTCKSVEEMQCGDSRKRPLRFERLPPWQKIAMKRQRTWQQAAGRSESRFSQSCRRALGMKMFKSRST